MPRRTCLKVLDNRGAVAEYVRQGLTVRQIAERLDVTTRTVWRYKHDLGLTVPNPAPLPPERWVEAEQLLDEGAPYAEVARTIGCEWHAVKERFPGRGWTRTQCGIHARLLDRYTGVAS